MPILLVLDDFMHEQFSLSIWRSIQTGYTANTDLIQPADCKPWRETHRLSRAPSRDLIALTNKPTMIVHQSMCLLAENKG